MYAIPILHYANIFRIGRYRYAPTFIFFDKIKEKIDAYDDILGNFTNIKFVCGSLDDIIKKYYHRYRFGLVSPANSYGDMCNGINRDIVKQFPLCQKNVLELIKRSSYKDPCRNPYMPVGVCGISTLDNKDNISLVAPTMTTTPQNIQGTDNVYLAFSAICQVMKKLPTDMIILCPCLGTGIGGMTGEESAKQIVKFFTYNDDI